MTTPPWNLVGVLGDDTSPSFVYSIDAASHHAGGFDLHLWSQATDGTDPGVGFAFSQSDMARIVNATLEAIVAGEATVGDSWTESFDLGLTEVTFTIGEPGDREAVDAFRTSSPVAPLRWSLSRPRVEGDEVAIAARMEQHVRGLLSEWLVPVPDRRPGPYGPATFLIDAWAALISADAGSVFDVLRFQAKSVAATDLRRGLGVAATAASVTGRDAQFTEIVDVTRTFTVALWPDSGDGDTDRAVRSLLQQVLCAGAASWLVDDVIDQLDRPDWFRFATRIGTELLWEPHVPHQRLSPKARGFVERLARTNDVGRVRAVAGARTARTAAALDEAVWMCAAKTGAVVDPFALFEATGFAELSDTERDAFVEVVSAAAAQLHLGGDQFFVDAVNALS